MSNADNSSEGASSASINHNSATFNLRKEYTEEGIHHDDDESSLFTDPLKIFSQWFDHAKTSNVLEPNAMCLATASVTGAPSARYVLLKGFDSNKQPGKFLWYTNYNSRKARDLAENPQAALCFWWGEIERSVRVEGRVEKVTEEESEEYFFSRPVGARLGAISSNQSEAIESRALLEDRFDALKKEHLGENGEEKKTVQRPPHWGGYCLVPHTIEFWKGRKSRIHDRLSYTYNETEEKWIV
eukprot:CAMPEP_0195537124 /NCGR_PEP_ID=MMETSP0794_2-20130614/47397_1 /TAXON_ID=515487 /ORGANISM="Stephanopyxis turris, Strain CCMP 815" /LENGTH=241 /DNA_ID=CAMNT_0040670767 /DNA_START=137 /DNA_END=858 /DNA_ORIENTATION=+